MWHAWEKRTVSRVWWGNLKKRDLVVDLGVDRNIMLKIDVK